jgi:hypothetical protein
MVAWEGRFSWQAYALTGRPDFLNYLHTGDVQWEQLWEFYRHEPASPEAVRSLVRLFHLFLSSEYDRAGCWLDPEGETYSRLRHWAEFTQDNAERIPLCDVQADLACLVGAGMVTPLYYQAVYMVFAETSVDRQARQWPGEGAPERTFESTKRFFQRERRLPAYHPGPSRFPDLQHDSAWNETLNLHLAAQYDAWNQAYMENLPDAEGEEEWSVVGGES